MATLVVTVAWRGRRRDLAVPADVPIAELLRPLATAVALGGPCAGLGATPGRPPPPGCPPSLALAPLGGAPLPPDRTLTACGIGDGAVLVLIGGDPASGG